MTTKYDIIKSDLKSAKFHLHQARMKLYTIIKGFPQAVRELIRKDPKTAEILEKIKKEHEEIIQILKEFTNSN